MACFLSFFINNSSCSQRDPVKSNPDFTRKALDELKPGIIANHTIQPVTPNHDPIYSHFQSKINALDMKHRMAESRSHALHAECFMLRHERREMHQRIHGLERDRENMQERVDGLSDELVVTNDNYIRQLSLLTQHVCELENKLKK